MPNTSCYSAIKCTQNRYTFYLSVIKSEELKNICFISRRSENKLKGFQRLLNASRANDIAKYLDENKGVIPSPIILSAQHKASLLYNPEDNTIQFNQLTDCFLVIDGQHRLYGLFESKNNYDVPVVIFDNLDLSSEVKLFVDINTNQRGVPTSLLLDIKQLAGIETSRENRQRNLYDSLDKKSPLSGYLSSSTSVQGKISRTVLYDATTPIFDNGPLSDKDDEIIYKSVNSYLLAFERVFSESASKGARITKTAIFKAIFLLFNEIISKCLGEHGNAKSETVYQVIKSLSNLDYDTYTGTNNATILRIAKDMRIELNKYYINEDMFD